MSAPPKHRDAIVNAAVTLFRRKGYSGTGLADILELSGAPRGSVYHYFPDGKSAIGQAAIAEAGRRVVETIEQLARETATTSALLKAHAKLLAGWMGASDFRDGCPITTALLEMAPQDEGITAAGREAYAARQKVLTEKLIADGFTLSKATRLAILCSSAIQGSLIQARVERSDLPILATAEELGSLISLYARSKMQRR